MMAFDYTGMAATVTELLSQFDEVQDAVVRATPTDSSDPAAGMVSPGTPVDTPCLAVRTSYDERYTPGATVEVGDGFYVLDGPANPEDKLIVAGVTRKILRVWPIVPGGSTLLASRVQVRG